MNVESTFHYPITSYCRGGYTTIFQPVECDEIIRLGHLHEFESATVYVDKPGVQLDSVRSSRISPICNVPDQAWVYDRIGQFIVKMNHDMGWNFALNGLELIQFSEYRADYGGKFTPHLDILDTTTNRCRKISVCIQLSSPEDYDGGELVPFNWDPSPKERGTATVFPSWYPHEVKPVTRGTRYSLVAWAVGPKFV